MQLYTKFHCNPSTSLVVIFSLCVSMLTVKTKVSHTMIYSRLLQLITSTHPELSHNPYLFDPFYYIFLVFKWYFNKKKVNNHLQVKSESESFALTDPAAYSHTLTTYKWKEKHSSTGTKAHGIPTDKKPFQKCIIQQSCCNAFK